MARVSHKLEYGVYVWDTFDNETDLIEEFNRLGNAVSFVEARYEGRLNDRGADQVEIVDLQGNIKRMWKLG